MVVAYFLFGDGSAVRASKSVGLVLMVAQKLLLENDKVYIKQKTAAILRVTSKSLKGRVYVGLKSERS